MMKATLPLKAISATAMALAIYATPAMATPGGSIGTLERGNYVCEHPGDAATGRGISAPEEGFRITNASTYVTPDGGGTYLRTGDKVTMTSGPRKGDRYVVKSENFLNKVKKDGSAEGLRCIRLGVATS